MKMKILAVLVAVLTASPAWSQFQGFPQKSCSKETRRKPVIETEMFI